VIRYPGLAALSSLVGGDQYYPIGRPGPIDSGGGRILEYVDGFNVRGAEVVDVSHCNPVHDIERIGIVNGPQTPYRYLGSRSRLSVVPGNAYPGCDPLEGLHGRCGVQSGDILSLDI